MKFNCAHSHVVEIHKLQPNPKNPNKHPEKQIDMLAKIIDLFGGSGSTLIACEKTNRKCFMMELDPHYCDVILARWEKYSGKNAELIDHGKEEIKKDRA